MNPAHDTSPRPTPLSVHVTDADADAVRVAAAGEIDMVTAPLLGDAITEVLRDRRPSRIDVDLADVTFMDSSGINTLVGCRGQARLLGCEMRLTNPATTVHRVLEISGLLDAFGLAPLADRVIGAPQG